MIDYATNSDTPGMIWKPGDTESKVFRPDGYFALFASGPIANAFSVWGIPTILLGESNVAELYSELQPGFFLSDACKAAGFECLPGLTIELRAEGANECFVSWGYTPNSVWAYKSGGLI